MLWRVGKPFGLWQLQALLLAIRLRLRLCLFSQQFNRQWSYNQLQTSPHRASRQRKERQAGTPQKFLMSLKKASRLCRLTHLRARDRSRDLKAHGARIKPPMSPRATVLYLHQVPMLA